MTEINNLPVECSKFFTQLENNNNRLWFEKNKSKFQTKILNPIRQLVGQVGEKLHSLSPEIIADPRINKSIFRINRDIRFSKDKSPYKTHQGIIFWNGNMTKLESPGFYLHLDTSHIYIGGGYHLFPKRELELFRQTLENPIHNDRLFSIVQELQSNGYSIDGKHYKRYPKGFDSSIANNEYLLYNGLWTYRKINDFGEICNPDFVENIFNIFKDFYPLYEFLCDVIYHQNPE